MTGYVAVIIIYYSSVYSVRSVGCSVVRGTDWLVGAMCFICHDHVYVADSRDATSANMGDATDIEDVDDSGVGLAALECVMWENNDFINAEGEMSSRVEWTVVVGDMSGRVFLVDITDVRFMYIGRWN